MKSKAVKTLSAVFKTLILIFFVLFGFSFYQIYSSVKEKCLSATEEYEKGCVGSLIEVIKSDEHSFKEKNGAVWALGQIADKKALPFLKSLSETALYEEPCKLNESICGFEVQRAIKWCTKGNVTSWMYTSLTK
jgi:hypothetical protein